jgi:hypothetical protein
MPTPFTLYACGTGYNRSANDIVARLNRETVSSHVIFDGPGSGGFIPGRGHNPGGASTLGGLIAGSGVDANVGNAVAAVKQALAAGPILVNMCGWSRGAITCFKIANALHDDRATRGIKCNIFAIDPVPGGSALNNHMWRNIGVSANIGMCNVVLAQHDRRSLFAPVYPTVDGPFTDVDIMPGDHSTIVEYKEGRSEAHELVYDMVKRFLRGRGTQFGDSSLLGTDQILHLYATIAAHFDDYAQFAKGVSGKPKDRFKEERPIRDAQRKVVAKMLPFKPAFFLNEHHRETCREQYPRIVNEIDRPIHEAFAHDRRSIWLPDFNRMSDQVAEHAKMVLFYIASCHG